MHVLVTEPYEEIVWNQKKFPKRKFFRAMEAFQPQKQKFETPGFLLTKGNYGHLLIGPVHHNGDVYRRSCPRRGDVYGSVKLLIQFGMKDAKLLTEAELIDMAFARRDYKRVERESDGLQLDVAMIFDWPTKTIPRSCGIHFANGSVNVFNPELPGQHNESEARYKDSALELLLMQRRSLL